MIQQHTVRVASTDNDKVTKYIDGEPINYKIMSYRETDGYCNALEDEGYSRAYDLDELLEELINAKEAYEHAQRRYNKAIPYKLIKAD